MHNNNPWPMAYDSYHYISNRGNIEGAIPGKENYPSYVQEAIKKRYEVKIDVWNKGGSFFLGFSRPQYKIDLSFLKNKKLWCHARNPETLSELMKHEDIHCFWHQNDDYTLTSNGYIWSKPGKTGGEIIVLPEKFNINPPKNSLGVCSDYIKHYYKRR